MKTNKWTMGLAAAGVVSLASTAQAEENSVLTALSSTVISGNVEASYVGGFSTNNNLYNDGAFEANGASLSIGSPLGGGDYSAGYNVELLLGDRGEVFAGDSAYLKNANIGLNVPFGNGIDLTVGLFDTIVGYEVEASGSNPNVKRSYGYAIEPLTHTGVLASTSLTDGVNVSLGLTNGFDNTGDHMGQLESHAQLGYLAALDVTAPDSLGFLGGSTAYIGMVGGNNEGNADYGDDDELFYVGLSLNTPIENLSVGLAYDDRQYADDRKADVELIGGVPVDVSVPQGAYGIQEAAAVALYAVYEFNDSLSIAARYDNITYEADTTTTEITTGVVGSRSFEDTVEMVTLTLDYQIWENVLTRLEFGWESGAGTVGTYASDYAGRTADHHHNGEIIDDQKIGDSSYFALNFFYSF